MDVHYLVYNSHHWSLSRRSWSRCAGSHPISLQSTLIPSWSKLYPFFNLVIGCRFPGPTYRFQNGAVIAKAVLRVTSSVGSVCNSAEFNVPANLSYHISFSPSDTLLLLLLLLLWWCRRLRVLRQLNVGGTGLSIFPLPVHWVTCFSLQITIHYYSRNSFLYLWLSDPVRNFHTHKHSFIMRLS